jgi:hypothetical protein
MPSGFNVENAAGPRWTASEQTPRSERWVARIRIFSPPASISLKKVWFLSVIFVSLLNLYIPVQEED